MPFTAPFDSNGWYTKAINYHSGEWRSPNYWKTNSGRKAVVLHVTDGIDSRFTLCNANTANPVSTHFLVREEGIYQHVSLNDSAWANGIWEAGHAWRGIPESENPNRYTISIEREGKPFVPVSQRINELSIQLLRDIATQYPQFRPYVPHVNLIGHYEISPAHRANCPGPTLDFNAYAAAANAALAPATPDDGLPSPLPYLGVDKQPITAATFKAVLTDHKSPLAPFADAIYQWLTSLNISADVWLGQCAKESSFMTTGLSLKNCNPLNRRARGDEPQQGGFADYLGAPWLGALASAVHLKWYHGQQGRYTLEDIVPIFAPSSENDVAQYIAFVRRTVADIRKREA